MDNLIAPEIWAKMLAPISSEQPAGVDTREDISPTSLYQQIRDARVLARNNERANLAAGEAQFFSFPEWAVILDKAPQLLAEQSKDLEIVAWYIEALTRHHHFWGLATGFKLAGEIIAAFGDAVYPLADEDGIATQLSALSGLNGYGAEGTLIAPIKSLAITQGDTPGPLATWQCDQAFEIARINDEERRQARLKQGGISKEEMEKVVAQTQTDFLRDTVAGIDAAIKHFAEYQAILDQFASSDPQPTGKIKEALEGCKQTLVYLAGPRIISLEASDKADEQHTTGDDSSTEGNSDQGFHGPVRDRHQAIAQLGKIADFFRQTEPHSPISYSIEQAIRWSDLPLTELIKELIPDDPARQKFKHLSGIQSENTK